MAASVIAARKVFGDRSYRVARLRNSLVRLKKALDQVALLADRGAEGEAVLADDAGRNVRRGVTRCTGGLEGVGVGGRAVIGAAPGAMRGSSAQRRMRRLLAPRSAGYSRGGARRRRGHGSWWSTRPVSVPCNDPCRPQGPLLMAAPCQWRRMHELSILAMSLSWAADTPSTSRSETPPRASGQTDCRASRFGRRVRAGRATVRRSGTAEGSRCSLGSRPPAARRAPCSAAAAGCQTVHIGASHFGEANPPSFRGVEAANAAPRHLYRDIQSHDLGSGPIHRSMRRGVV